MLTSQSGRFAALSGSTRPVQPAEPRAAQVHVVQPGDGTRGPRTSQVAGRRAGREEEGRKECRVGENAEAPHPGGCGASAYEERETGLEPATLSLEGMKLPPLFWATCTDFKAFREAARATCTTGSRIPSILLSPTDSATDSSRRVLSPLKWLAAPARESSALLWARDYRIATRFSSARRRSCAASSNSSRESGRRCPSR
jgi:hypothetical protein